MDHDSFSRNTRLQLRQVLDALRELMVPPDPPKRPIGFVPPRRQKRRPNTQGPAQEMSMQRAVAPATPIRSHTA